MQIPPLPPLTIFYLLSVKKKPPILCYNSCFKNKYLGNFQKVPNVIPNKTSGAKEIYSYFCVKNK